MPPSSRGPTTVVQTEPFRGLVSLLPSEPTDVPEGWTLWTPVTVPEVQRVSRQRAYDNQHLQSLELVDSAVAAPQHQYDIVRAVRAEKKANIGKKIDFYSPDVITGAEEEVELGTLSDEVDIAQNPRIQFVKRVSQARPTNLSETGRSRKSSTPAPTKAPTKQTRLRLIAPRRPSTPEQVALFEEAMQSPAQNDAEITDSHVHQTSPVSTTSPELNEARYLIVMAQIAKKKEEFRDAGLDPASVGASGLCGEGVLFNPLDWE